MSNLIHDAVTRGLTVEDPSNPGIEKIEDVSALTASRTITYPDFDVNLGYLNQDVTIGSSPILRLRTGAPPTNTSDADTGTVIAVMYLPITWMTSGSSGAISMVGDWYDSAADNAGEIGHFRIYDSGDTTCHFQGTVTESGGGGDMIVDESTVAVAQKVEITSFTLNDPNG